MSEFTKGPWKVYPIRFRDQFSCTIQTRDGKKNLAKVDLREGGKANAHLIAAAPEMYEAICDFLHGYCEESVEEFADRRSDMALKFREIKNKAEGK